MTAVVETDIAAQVEDVGARIGNFPALGYPRTDDEMLITPHQRVEDQLVNELRLRVRTDTRIEVGGAELNDHHQRVGRGWMRARYGNEGYQEKREPRRTRRHTK